MSEMSSLSVISLAQVRAFGNIPNKLCCWTNNVAVQIAKHTKETEFGSMMGIEAKSAENARCTRNKNQQAINKNVFCFVQTSLKIIPNPLVNRVYFHAVLFSTFTAKLDKFNK